MHEQPNPDPWLDHRTVLDLLIANHLAPWTVAELARALAGGQDAPAGPSTTHASDTLADLYGSGLVNRVGDLYVASRAAVEGARLAVA